MNQVATEMRYTLAEANRLLPLLRSIAAEIEERRSERRELTRMLDELNASHTPEGLGDSVREIEALLFRNREATDAALAEFEHLGLTVLRVSPLTIHIPGRTQRGPLVFCWQFGEESIGHGHLIGEEDDPRRPLRVVPANGQANTENHDAA
ncbi:MAG: DUF2203 family protein [Planctomycetota bacterium]|jgi:hypothetical protein